MSHSTVPRSRAEAKTSEEAPRGTDIPTGERPGKKLSGRLSLRLRLRRDRTLILMTLPAIALVLVFNYIPILGNVVAFQEYDPYVSDNGFVAMLESPWVGLEQFERIFADSAFWDAVQNTLVLFVLQLVLFFPIPIVLALLINSVIRPRVRAVSQAILYLPHFFSWVLVITVFQQIFGGAGIIAQTLREHGYEGFDLMTDPGIFKFLVTAEGVWKDAGWGIIVFLAALASVSPDLYEAAAMDGAGRWRRMWHVTLPALRPVIALLLVLRVGDALTVGFEQILLQRDAVGPGASEVLDTYVWWNGVRNQDFSYAAAAGLVKGLVSVALVLAANKVAHFMGEQGVYKK
ncbi:polysaccharide ABC transporter ATP-binding protein [Streptomyces violarus]|uniref:Putative aldouronate transport system permease protein n=1 Tax=Streptomyces violarus TaxID=67380 RepID=A0A7W5F527_9ACTN|nr:MULTISPECIES: ABC transporter permease subunit [Streptomyces]MBB3080447.1 putative aldouronate transport system permease protein [Streptomyces violarus]WRT98287.1 ABC transporter permease subunit [Streptomyces sp. CGMCC 4.1772]GHD30612.1 polysaccharide ABC transporter ATP-binding protein [Streptomyces violarus]